ncbi:hypothetical protein [Streptomyces sp. NL15-2K]|uniref:hypothetical protein n=1 Tax=Streptomyces sp. NL15-2K TaxID=376149 RepID=UPI00155AE30A|nr:MULTISPECIES: hypothetical protein [Actinomycetes]WKX10865.1 hypothetical protein Q4V64_26520 [Kutzneria buriramensis]
MYRFVIPLELGVVGHDQHGAQAPRTVRVPREIDDPTRILPVTPKGLAALLDRLRATGR